MERLIEVDGSNAAQDWQTKQTPALNSDYKVRQNTAREACEAIESGR